MVSKRKTSRRKSKSETAKSKADDESITISKTALWQIVSGVLAVVLVAMFIFSMAGNNAQAPVPGQPGAAPAPGPAAPSGPVTVNLEGANTLGNPDASVTMVEYSSFTCPFCGRYHSETKSDIIQNFVDTGDVFYVYKHFPRNQEDIRVANHAECAGDQGSFFDFIDRVYANQQSIGDATLRGYAQDLGLDMNAYDACVASGVGEQRATANLREGQQNGIQGTPGFLINDVRVSGAQPYQNFAAAIQSQLN